MRNEVGEGIAPADVWPPYSSRIYGLLYRVTPKSVPATTRVLQGINHTRDNIYISEMTLTLVAVAIFIANSNIIRINSAKNMQHLCLSGRELGKTYLRICEVMLEKYLFFPPISN